MKFKCHLCEPDKIISEKGLRSHFFRKHGIRNVKISRYIDPKEQVAYQEQMRILASSLP